MVYYQTNDDDDSVNVKTLRHIHHSRPISTGHAGKGGSRVPGTGGVPGAATSVRRVAAAGAARGAGAEFAVTAARASPRQRHGQSGPGRDGKATGAGWST